MSYIFAILASHRMYDDENRDIRSYEFDFFLFDDAGVGTLNHLYNN